MRKTTLVLLVSGYLSMGALCNTENRDDHSVTVIIPGSGGVTGGSVGVGVGGTCAPVDRIRIVEAPGELAVNAQAAIDVTPRDGAGQLRSDACNEASGNDWTPKDEHVCSVGEPKAFKTFVKGNSPGECILTAEVDDQRDSVSFFVR